MIYILLPAYNEKKNLERIFVKLKKLRKKIKFKVILVDDCSTDNTEDLVKLKYDFKIIYIKHKSNKGLSLTLRSGFKRIEKIAKANDKVITLDSDNTHPIDLINKLNIELKNKDIVVASRFVKGSKVFGVTLFRSILSLGAKSLFKIFYPHERLSDYTSNFRGYKFFLIKKILKIQNFFENEDFNITSKIIVFFILKVKNLRLSEIAFKLRYDNKIGQSKIRLIKSILLTLKLLIKKPI